MKIGRVVRSLLISDAGRMARLGLLGRLCAWQIWWRMTRRPMVFTGVTGAKFQLLPRAAGSLSGIWYQQLPDFNEMCFAMHLLRPGELFVDVGANQGGWTLTMAAWGARVAAFEPVPLTNERLRANVALNTNEIGERIQVYGVGLGETTAEVRFSSDLDTGNHQLDSREPSRNGGIQVKLLRMDDILSAEAPVLIKIDVEGSELSVLKGATETLKKPSLLALVIETFRPLNYQRSDLKKIEGLLKENGFLPSSYAPALRSLAPLQGPADGGQNTIYVRAGANVDERLNAAAPIRVFKLKI